MVYIIFCSQFDTSLARILQTITNYNKNQNCKDCTNYSRWELGLKVGVLHFFLQGGWSFTEVLDMFHEKGGFKEGEIENIEGRLWSWKKLYLDNDMRLKSTYFRILTQKEWQHVIYKTWIKQIIISIIYY